MLIRRDRAWKIMPLAALICGATSLESYGFMLFATGLSLFLVLSLPFMRATLFEGALPIQARDLFLVRSAALGSLIWIPAAVAATVAGLHDNHADASRTIAILCDCACGASLVAMASLSSHVRELAAPARTFVPVFYGLSIAIFLAFLFLPAAPVLAVCVAGSAVLFIRALNALPSCFQAAPEYPRKAHAERASAGEPWLFRFPWMPAMRSLDPLQCAAFLPICIMNDAQSGGIAGMMFFAGLCTALSAPKTAWLQAYPISRRKLLAAGLAMGTLPFVFCEAAIRVAALALPARTVIEVGNHEYRKGPKDRAQKATPNVEIPLTDWTRTEMDRAPAIQAPWGESVEPPRRSVLGIRIYNPYATGRNSSRRFFEWQFERATRALYERPIRYSAYEEALKQGLPRRPATVWVVAQDSLAIAICGALGLALAGLGYWRGWSRYSAAWRRFTMIGLFALALLAYALLAVSPLLNDDLAVAILFATRAVFQNAAIVFGLGAPVFAALFWIAERLFAIAEWPRAGKSRPRAQLTELGSN